MWKSHTEMTIHILNTNLFHLEISIQVNQVLIQDQSQNQKMTIQKHSLQGKLKLIKEKIKKEKKILNYKNKHVTYLAQDIPYSRNNQAEIN